MTRFVTLVACAFCATAPLAADWPHWRGPNLDGTSTETGLPLTWSKAENVSWRADLPAWGAATPIVVGDRVFVVSPARAAESAGSVARRLPRSEREHPGGKDLLLLVAVLRSALRRRGLAKAARQRKRALRQAEHGFLFARVGRNAPLGNDRHGRPDLLHHGR